MVTIRIKLIAVMKKDREELKHSTTKIKYKERERKEKRKKRLKIRIQ